jgi:hypothetical protein
LLYLYTSPFDVIVDPFAGGGSTIDICKKRLRRYFVSDRKPIVEREKEIRTHDLTSGLTDDCGDEKTSDETGKTGDGEEEAARESLLPPARSHSRRDPRSLRGNPSDLDAGSRIRQANRRYLGAALAAGRMVAAGVFDVDGRDVRTAGDAGDGGERVRGGAGNGVDDGEGMAQTTGVNPHCD